MRVVGFLLSIAFVAGMVSAEDATAAVDVAVEAVPLAVKPKPVVIVDPAPLKPCLAPEEPLGNIFFYHTYLLSKSD